MIASWMLYALLVSVLVAAAAWLGEEVCRLRGAPVRWVWAGGLAVTLVLVALAPARVVPPSSSASPLALPAATDAVGAAAETRWRPAALLAAARETLARPLRAAAELGDGPAGPALAAGWGALSLALLALGGTTLARAARARRRWPRREIDGVAVRVAPTVGPAVLGIRRPEVVVPGWLLAQPAEAQRLVVLHEREHIRARDPLTLAAGCLAAALLPWNPVAWWMLLRLRLAVEMDCDTRVLRRGVRPRAYGALLIEMAGRGPGLGLGVPAMAGTPSTLERRLRAMTPSLPRFAPARAGLLGLLGAAALMAACDTPIPTTADVQAMDASTAQQQAVRLRMVEGGEMTYFVDGRQVSADEANALVADRIAEIEVQKNAAGGGTIRISTQLPTRADGVAAPADEAVRFRTTVPTRSDATAASGDAPVRIRIRGEGAGEVRTLETRRLEFDAATDTLPPQRVTVRTGGPGSQPFAGLVVIDGVIVESSAMESLDPGRIDKVEVIKGPAAAAQFTDPRAANGVIRITTKAAAQP